MRVAKVFDKIAREDVALLKKHIPNIELDDDDDFNDNIVYPEVDGIQFDE